jgi:hypothetical protein
MKMLGLKNSLAKAFSDTVVGTTFAEGHYNCTVFLFDEPIPTDLNTFRSASAGYKSDFNYELVKDCVGMFNAKFYYDQAKDKFALTNATGASENQSSSLRKNDQYAPEGISCLLLPSVSPTSMVTPVASTLPTNTLYYAPSVLKQLPASLSVTDIQGTSDFSAITQVENFAHPRLGSNRPVKNILNLVYGDPNGFGSHPRIRIISKYKQAKTFDRILIKISYSIRVDACTLRIHAKSGQGAFNLVTEFRFVPTETGKYLEINLPPFEADTIHLSGHFLAGGLTQGSPGVINLSELVFGRSGQTSEVPALTSNFGIVAFGTKDYGLRMNDPNGRFVQSHVPMFLLETGSGITKLDTNLNVPTNFLRLNKNVEFG